MERKNFEIRKETDGWMFASTPAVDRDRDRVLPMGAEMGDFAKNPVLMFGHNYQDPWSIIGRVAETTVGADGIRFRPELRQAANESDPMNIIRLLWDDGLLRAASIGFNPIEWRENEFGGRDFTRWSLLEVSLVALPANQEALRLAAKGMDSTPAEIVLPDEETETQPETKADGPEAEAAGNAAPVDEDEADGESKESLLLDAISDFLNGATARIEELRQ